MSVRAKIVAIAIFGMALYVVFAFLFGWRVVSPIFTTLENQQAQRDILRCMEAIDREVQHLDQFCFDWACWDDTYAYVDSPNEAYESSNLIDATLADNRLNMLYVVRNNGQVVWGKAYDLQKNEVVDFPDFAGPTWGAAHPLLAHQEPEDAIAGLLLTSRGVMLVSSRPIVTSNMEGPIRGALVMGRLLSGEMVEQLREQTQVDMQVRPLPETWAEQAPEQILAPRAVRIQAVDLSTLGVSAVFANAYGAPAFLLQARVPRAITRAGAQVSRLAAWSVLGGGLACLWAMLYLMRRAVITPLTRLTRHVTQISETGEMALLDPRGRKDEFGVLSRQFNRMLVRLENDAAARERAQRALLESEERFQRLLQSIDDMVWSSSADGKQVFFANPAAETVFGRPPEAFVDDPGLLRALIHPDDRAQADASLQRVCESGHAEAEYRILRPDGAMRWVHDRRALVRDAEGNPLRIAGIISDITDLKHMHERMSETQRLAELGEMGASIAHELRNPLAGIGGALQVIRGGFPEDEPRRDAIDEALSQVARMEQTVQHVLRYAKPWMPRRNFADLRGFARTAMEHISAQFALEGIVCEVEPGPPLRLAFDPDLLEEACANVVQNAAHLMPDGGRIRVDFRASGGQVEMRIHDEGPGFAPEALSRALDPFFTTKTRGTGLGLVICRRILEAHGGGVRLENRAGGGATVILLLPTEEN